MFYHSSFLKKEIGFFWFVTQEDTENYDRTSRIILVFHWNCDSGRLGAAKILSSVGQILLIDSRTANCD